MRRLFTFLLPILASAMLAADPPINGNAARPGFVPPELKGLRGDNAARRANGPIPFPAEDERWIEVRSKHFDFISAAGEKKTRAMAQDLETLAAALSRLNPAFVDAQPAPTRVFLFTRRKEAQPYFDMLMNRRDASVSGIFVTQDTSASIVMLTGFRAANDRTAFHELVHNLIESHSQPPLWLDEGLAEYFSNVELRKGSIYAGEPIAHHIDELRRNRVLPLQTLFSVVRESDTYNLRDGQSLFYAESWAAVDWLLREAGRDRTAFYDFFRDVVTGTPVEVALKNRYQRNLDDMQNAVAAYGALSRPTFGITVKVPEADTSAEIKPLSRAATLFAFGRFLSGLDEMAPDAERHFRAALEADPHYARALAAIAVLRAKASKYDDASKLFDQSLAEDPNDPAILLDYAEALMRNQIGPVAEGDEVSDEDAPRFRKARELATKALEICEAESAPTWSNAGRGCANLRGRPCRLGADAGRVQGDIGTTYMVENDADLAPGIAALEKAHALLPARTDFALHLFAMLRRTRDVAKTDALFATLDASRNAQVAYVARAIVTRVELNRANALSHQGKLTEAAAVLRELAEKTPDPNAKRDLASQIDELLKVDATNRQIADYNDAVAQVNLGKYSVARKMLASILATTTDPELIRDIRALQKQLAGRKDVGSR